MIVIIDYGMGNIGSLLNMIKKVGGKAQVSRKADEINKASKLILPGVGAFDNGMKNLNELGFSTIIRKKAMDDKIPCLGICLGMQLLTKSSEEGTLKGLGVFNAETVKFRFNRERQKLKIPHMGWNEVVLKKNSVLFRDMYGDPAFYFVHSYYVKSLEETDILTSTFYGHEFASSLERNNVFATQFHPEKSHKYGMKFMQNFVFNT